MENTDIYDGVGIINYDKIKMLYKQTDGFVVTIESRESMNSESKYSFLKGIIKPIDLSKLFRKGIKYEDL